MALWGEISEPASRATWNDDEEADYSFLCDKKLPRKEKIDTFMILEGTYFGKYNCEPSHRLILSIPEINLKLFEDENGSKVICCIKNYELINSSEIVQFLSEYLIISGMVIALISKSLAEYKVGTINNSCCVIRSLWTTKWTQNVCYPQLEQPNIISGVSAGAMMLREQLDKDAVAHVCYVDHPDCYDTAEITTLLQSLNIRRINAQLSHVTTSNLYI